MSEWIERKNWSRPVSASTYVEICGRDQTQTKRGAAADFSWNYDPDGEGNIHFYKVLSSFATKAKELQTKMVEVQLPDNELVIRMPDMSTCGLFMDWWEKQGVEKFYEWHDSLEGCGKRLKLMRTTMSKEKGKNIKPFTSTIRERMKMAKIIKNIVIKLDDEGLIEEVCCPEDGKLYSIHVLDTETRRDSPEYCKDVEEISKDLMNFF